MAKELYVGHISEQATEEDLRKLFELMGVVTSVHLIVDEQTGEFKRCGYVRMLSEVNLNEVVETLDGTYLIDRCIVVSIAVPQKDRPAKTPFVRRTPMASARHARPAVGARPAASARPAAAKPAKSSRPAVKEATKTGRSSAAKEAVKKYRPKGRK
ncbi:MAG TPA: RNA-binding protein [Desulfuromonadales bacterium]|nr:RNA-binding protein [Desulfuromonadales bacterium]